MVSLLTKAFEQVGQSHKADDDFIDRLNHRFTVILLVTFTAFVSAKQFMGNPISCWTPAHFSKQQITYTDSICWVKGTYYLETDRLLIPHRTQNSEFRIAYYQFVPYMLLVMALLFYLPYMFWRNISRHIGFDFRLMIQSIKTLSTIDQMALQIHIALEYNSLKRVAYNTKSLHRLLETIRYRNLLTLLYIFVKILYTINCLCQFYILSLFLSFPFYSFGYDWLWNILTKVHNRATMEAYESRWFPRVVMCDFMVRHLGSNQHWMAIQCNLPINLFNELIFLIIWAWLIFLTGLTCVSFLFSLISIYTNIDRTCIRKYLHMSLPKITKEEEDDFIENYLKWDGIIVLKIIDRNTNDIIMANLVRALFRIHSESSKKENNEQILSHGHYMHIENTSI